MPRGGYQQCYKIANLGMSDFHVFPPNVLGHFKLYLDFVRKRFPLTGMPDINIGEMRAGALTQFIYNSTKEEWVAHMCYIAQIPLNTCKTHKIIK